MAVDGRVGHWRAGVDRRAGRRLLHQSLWHCVSRRTTQRRGRPRTRSRSGDAMADDCSCRSLRADRAGSAAVALGVPAGGGHRFAGEPGIGCEGERKSDCRPADGRCVWIVHLAGADRAHYARSAEAAGRPPRGTKCHVGLRLRCPHAAHAVHGFFVRSADYAAVSLVSAAARRSASAAGAVSSNMPRCTPARPICFDDTSMSPYSWALPGWPRSCDGCRRDGFRYTCSTSP